MEKNKNEKIRFFQVPRAPMFHFTPRFPVSSEIEDRARRVGGVKAIGARRGAPLSLGVRVLAYRVRDVLCSRGPMEQKRGVRERHPERSAVRRITPFKAVRAARAAGPGRAMHAGARRFLQRFASGTATFPRRCAPSSRSHPASTFRPGSDGRGGRRAYSPPGRARPGSITPSRIPDGQRAAATALVPTRPCLRTRDPQEAWQTRGQT